jgi:hypothetical protein
VPRHIGLQVPGREQGFGDTPELGDVIAGIDGPGLGLNSELMTEIALQHGLHPLLRNVKQWRFGVLPVSRTAPSIRFAGFAKAARATGELRQAGLARPLPGGETTDQTTGPAT